MISSNSVFCERRQGMDDALLVETSIMKEGQRQTLRQKKKKAVV
jgi:hypothetical protein